MEFWSNVWWLVKRDAGRLRLGLVVWPIIFIVFGFYVALLSDYVYSLGNRGDRPYEAVMDIVFLLAVTLMGSVFTAPAFQTGWSGRGTAKRLAFQRSLPIRAGELIASRFILMLLAYPVAGTAFFATIYLMSVWIRELLGPWQYILFILFWFGYYLLVSAYYLYLETRFEWAVYCRLSILNAILLFLFPAALQLAGVHLVEGIARLIERLGIGIPVAVLASGALAVRFLLPVSEKRLRMRDWS